MMPTTVLGMLKQMLDSEGRENRSKIERDIIEVLFGSESELIQLLEMVATTTVPQSPAAGKLELAKSAALGSVLAELRFTIDNGSERSVNKLKHLEQHLAGMLNDDTLSLRGALEIANVWLSSGFDAPEFLPNRDAELAEVLELAAEDAPHELYDFIQPILQEVQAIWGALNYNLNYKVYTFLAVMPPKTRQHFTRIAVSEPEEIFGKVGCNLLLSKEAEVRAGAIEGFDFRLENGLMTEGILSRLEIVRPWINDKGICLDLDRILVSSLNSGLGWRYSYGYLNIKKIMTCFPDARGGQNIYILLQSGIQTLLANIVIRSHSGVRDAYFKPTDSQDKTNQIFQEIESDSDYFEVPIEYVSVACSLSLAEGLHNGILPEMGLIDVLETIRVTDVYPQGCTVAEILARADVESKVAELTAMKRGKLVKSSEHWIDKFSIVLSWFEDDEYTESVIRDAKSPDEMEAGLWRLLEGRREFWCQVFARMALVAYYSKLPELNEFLAVAYAIRDGLELRKIPVMHHIFQRTLLVWEARTNVHTKFKQVKVINYQHPMLKDNNIDDRSLLELNEALQYNDRSVNWLDGYIVASFAAPKQLAKNELLEQTEKFVHQGKVKNISKLDELVNNILRRFAQISTVVSESQKIIVPSDKQIYIDWARGFLDCWNNNPGLWPRRILGGKVKRIKKLLEKASAGKSGPDDPRLVATLINEML